MSSSSSFSSATLFLRLSVRFFFFFFFLPKDHLIVIVIAHDFAFFVIYVRDLLVAHRCLEVCVRSACSLHRIYCLFFCLVRLTHDSIFFVFFFPLAIYPFLLICDQVTLRPTVTTTLLVSVSSSACSSPAADRSRVLPSPCTSSRRIVLYSRARASAPSTSSTRYYFSSCRLLPAPPLLSIHSLRRCDKFADHTA